MPFRLPPCKGLIGPNNARCPNSRQIQLCSGPVLQRRFVGTHKFLRAILVLDDRCGRGRERERWMRELCGMLSAAHRSRIAVAPKIEHERQFLLLRQTPAITPVLKYARSTRTFPLVPSNSTTPPHASHAVEGNCRIFLQGFLAFAAGSQIGTDQSHIDIELRWAHCFKNSCTTACKSAASSKNCVSALVTFRAFGDEAATATLEGMSPSVKGT